MTAASKMKMSVGATSAEPPTDVYDDLFDDDRPWSVDVELGEIEKTFNRLEVEAQVHATTSKRPKGVTAEHLSKIWSIDREAAERTIGITSQYVKHQESDHFLRRYPTIDRCLRYKRINTHFFMDTFFVTKRAKSQRGHRCMQLFVSDTGYMYVYPMKSKSEIPNAVRAFAKEVGVPTSLILDPEGTHKSKELRKLTQELACPLLFLERATQWANLAELYIGLLKEAVQKDMKDTDSPLVFWDYCAERRAKINNLTAKGLNQLQGSNANFKITGEAGDISNLCQFG